MNATIPIPAGFEMPEGIKPGQSFKLLTTFRMRGNRLEVLDIEGSDLDGEDGEDEMGFADAVKKNMAEKEAA